MHHYPEAPRVGVGVVVVARAQASVLLVRRGKAPSRGKWALPGGSIELGETAAAAAAREVLEECGLRVQIGPVIDVVDIIAPDADGRIEYHYVLCEYLAFAPDDLSTLAAADDAEEVRWVRWDEVGRLPDVVARVDEIVQRGWALMLAQEKANGTAHHSG